MTFKEAYEIIKELISNSKCYYSVKMYYSAYIVNGKAGSTRYKPCNLFCVVSNTNSLACTQEDIEEDSWKICIDRFRTIYNREEQLCIDNDPSLLQQKNIAENMGNE